MSGHLTKGSEVKMLESHCLSGNTPAGKQHTSSTHVGLQTWVLLGKEGELAPFCASCLVRRFCLSSCVAARSSTLLNPRCRETVLVAREHIRCGKASRISVNDANALLGKEVLPGKGIPGFRLSDKRMNKSSKSRWGCNLVGCLFGLVLLPKIIWRWSAFFTITSICWLKERSSESYLPGMQSTNPFHLCPANVHGPLASTS
ncbi:uncharacterized protein [Narcine bancroftii]|uniref:uncharacterized protein isoform X2 n=1 Tax=Narcine bancroftii TaxID=1343680 RepID=UPI0038313838